MKFPVQIPEDVHRRGGDELRVSREVWMACVPSTDKEKQDFADHQILPVPFRSKRKT